MPTLAGAYLHAHSLIKARILPIVFSISLFGTYVQVGPTSMLLLYQYICQHLILIKLIHSIIIILRVFVFYKQRVLANFWGRKDSAICASRKRRGPCYCAVHMKWAINSLFKPPALSFRPQKSAKTRCIYNINMRKMIIIDWIKKSSIKCWQRDSYNTKIEVGPICTSMPTLAGAYLHAHSLIKARILSICFQYFTIWHLCTSRIHLNVAIISVYLPTFDID